MSSQTNAGINTSPISCSYDPDSGGHDFDTISTAEGTKPKQTNMFFVHGDIGEIVS